MKRNTAKALIVVTSLAVAGTVAGAGSMSAVATAPPVAVGAYHAVPASYDTSVGNAAGDDRAAFAARASRSAARDAAHLRALRKAKAAKRHAAAAHRAHLRRAAAHRAALKRRLATAPAAPGSARAIGKHMAAARGWSGYQWAALDRLWAAESGWSTSASNAYGAYGIPQALPGSKLAANGADWRSNARTQIAWGLTYIAGRWGTPAAAWSHFQAARWY